MNRFFARLFERRPARRRRRPNGLGVIEGLESRQLLSATLGSLALNTGPTAADIAMVESESIATAHSPQNAGTFGRAVPAVIRSIEQGSVDTVVNGAGSGAGPHVFAVAGTRLPPASPTTFAGGLHVAAGDVNVDGRQDIVTRPGLGTIGVFVAAGDQTFVGGLHVAVGDVNADSRDDIVTGPGASAPGQRQTLRDPFDWLVHLDRPLISPIELLHVDAVPLAVLRAFSRHDENPAPLSDIDSRFSASLAIATGEIQPAGPSDIATADLASLQELIDRVTEVATASLTGRLPGDAVIVVGSGADSVNVLAFLQNAASVQFPGVFGFVPEEVGNAPVLTSSLSVHPWPLADDVIVIDGVPQSPRQDGPGSDFEFDPFDLGTRIKTGPNGYVFKLYANGASLEVFPDGRIIQTNPDGTSITEYPNGFREERPPFVGRGGADEHGPLGAVYGPDYDERREVELDAPQVEGQEDQLPDREP